MRAALLGLLLVGCAHKSLRVTERERLPAPVPEVVQVEETGFAEVLPPPSLDGAVASIGTVVPYGMRELTLAWNVTPGCVRGGDCFGRALTLTGTLTGVAADFTSTVTSAHATQAFKATTDGGKFCMNTGCTVYFAGDGFGGGAIAFGLGTNSTGNFNGTGSIVFDGSITAKTSLINGSTSAACSSNTGAVCVNDAGGLAVADGAGATVATVSAAGAAAFAATATAADYRVTSTNTFDANSHVADAGTGFTWDISTNLTSGIHTLWRDNATTTLASLLFDGSFLSAGRAVPTWGRATAAKVAYGEKATSAGTVAVDFTTEGFEDFGGTPVCLCGNTSNTTENECSATGEATTGVTLNGTDTDTYTWICIGAN